MHLIPLFYSSYKQGHNEGRNNAQGAKFLVDVNTLENVTSTFFYIQCICSQKSLGLNMEAPDLFLATDAI